MIENRGDVRCKSYLLCFHSKHLSPVLECRFESRGGGVGGGEGA